MTIKELAKEMAAWCIDNNAPTFHCWIRQSGHVQQIEFQVMLGGYDNCMEELSGSFYFNESAKQQAADIFSEMIKFKIKHDEFYSDEGIEARIVKAKSDKIASLQRQIEDLNK